jgi:hypothetical protein
LTPRLLAQRSLLPKAQESRLLSSAISSRAMLRLRPRAIRSLRATPPSPLSYETFWLETPKSLVKPLAKRRRPVILFER